MIWVLLVIIIGLMGVMGQLLMSFQKRAAKLRAIQEPLQRKLQVYQEHTEQVAAKLRKEIDPKIGHLEDDYETLKSRFERLFGVFTVLQREISEEDLADPKGKETVSIKPNDAAIIRETMYQARMEAEALSNYLEGYRNDLDMIRRNLVSLESGKATVEEVLLDDEDEV